MFRKFLAHLFPTTFAPSECLAARRTRRPSVARTRLSFEPLEARDVPASYWWGGWVSTDPTDADNWGPPDGGDPLPDQYDTLHYGPEVWTDPVTGLARDCVGLTSPGTSFAGIIIGEGYNGTVSLGEALTLGELSLADGAISQPTSGRELTVTDTFTWTGGTLNSSNYLSTLTLDGATATIAPASGGTVSLGSNITLTNGAVATMGEGTIELTNDGMEIDVEANCSFEVNPGTSATAAIFNLQSTHIQIAATASLTVVSGEFLGAGRLVTVHGGSRSLAVPVPILAA